MPKLKPSRDIQPVTEFRANAAQFIEQVQETPDNQSSSLSTVAAPPFCSTWSRMRGWWTNSPEGMIVAEIGRPTHREIWNAPYRVIYRVDASRAVVLTLRHWRREWDEAEVFVGA